MKSLIKLPSLASSVTRWQGVPLIAKRNNIAEHSFAVAFYADLIYNKCRLYEFGIDKGNLLSYCLIHDLGETVTGDIPTSAKQRVPEIKAVLDKIENDFMENDLGLIYSPPTDEIKFICKVADYICVALELVEEVHLGNTSQPILNAHRYVNNIFNKMFNETTYNIESSLRRVVQETITELGLI